MKLKIDINEPEFSRPVAVEKIPAAGFEQTLEAKDSERQKLVARFGLLDLPMLRAELHVRPKGIEQSVAVTGKLFADVVQSCVVTLEPLPSHIEEEIDVLFTLPELMEAVTDAAMVDVDRSDMEVIVDGVIDLGELVSQHLGVALDPYPRKAGVTFAETRSGKAETPPGPLAELLNLPKKPKDSK